MLGLFLIYRVSIVVHRLFCSPISKFPGPRLAAATSLYELYYNFVKNGKYVFEIERLHKVYGPIVRVNPYELSICDADFYDKLYVTGNIRPTDNYNHFVDGVDFQGSHFLTTPHDLHRARRKPLEPYFSRLGISRLEPVIQELAEKLVTKLDEFHEKRGTVVRLDHALLCYTGDMISRVCCENPTSLLDNDAFSADWYESLHTIIKSMPLFEGLPWLIRLVRLIPKEVLQWADPRSQLFNDWKDMAERHILDLKKEKLKQSPHQGVSSSKQKTLLRHLVNSDLIESELSTPRLVNEAQVLLGAGTVGTARVLDLICYYILASSNIRDRLAAELGPVMTNYPLEKPTWAQLERLVFLQSVVKEGLRLSFGVMRRLPRVSPTTAIQFREWTIPVGTPVGMSAYMQHIDPATFQDPFSFIPERWLPENVTPQMQRNFVPFSKGSRNCLGSNLAYAEMSHLLAALFRPHGPRLKLFDSTEEDVKLAHDFIVPLPRVDSAGLRVIIE